MKKLIFVITFALFVTIIPVTFSVVSAQTSTPTSSIVATNAKVFVKTMSKGARGEAVLALQKFLISRGHLAQGFATGYYGPATFNAVKKFQIANSLPAVGNVGPKTLYALNTSSAILLPTDSGTLNNISNNTSTATEITTSTESTSTTQTTSTSSPTLYSSGQEINLPYYRVHCDTDSRRSLSLIYPNLSESFINHSRVEVQWYACNYPSATVSLFLEYTPPNTSNPVYFVLADATPNDYTEIVTLPELATLGQAGAYYKIMVTDGPVPSSAVLLDKSDNTFSINY